MTCRSAILASIGALLLGPPAIAHPGSSTTIDHYTHQIEHDPENQRLYILRGIAYSNDGRHDAALADFTRAEQLGNPLLVSCDLGVLHYRMGDLDKAVAYLDRHLEQTSGLGYCLEYRARALRDKGDFPGAIRDFRRLLDDEPRPRPGHYISVANMLAASGERGIDEALAVLDAGIVKLGLTPQLQDRAIELELDRGRPARAVARSEALRPILGESPEWKVDTAELHLRNGDRESAAQMLGEAAAQLDTLRRTPARIRLRERIVELQARAELANRDGVPGSTTEPD